MQLELGVRPSMAAVDAGLIARQQSMTKALQLCQTLSGKDDAQFYGSGGIVKDQAQWSRIMGPSNHNFPHDKLNLFMDIAGNEAPLLYLLHSRGYELSSLHLRETETERELRVIRDRLAAVEAANLVLVNAMNGRAVA